MKDVRPPSFLSAKLQTAVEAARPFLEGAEEARDRVSNDIKALEAYLNSLDLKASLRHPVGKYLVPDDDRGRVAAALEYGGSASGTIEQEALVWSPDSNGRSRLLYELSRWDGYIEVDSPGGPYFWDETTLQREAKPLIETKFEIRKRMYQHLPDFVGSLAKHLAVDPRAPIVPNAGQDDVPF